MDNDQPETFQFDSTLLGSGSYVAAERTLTLVIRGEEKVYQGVDPGLWAELRSAPSPGRFYNAFIRGKFS